MNPILMTCVLLGTWSFFSWSVFRRLRQLKIGKPNTWVKLDWDDITARTKNVLSIAFGQKKMREKKGYRIAGLAHVAIFAAFNLLLLNSVLLWGRGYVKDWDFFFDLLSTENIFGQLYSFLKELSAAGAMIGALGFWYIRILRRGKDSGDPKEVGKRPRMTLSVEAHLILGIIVTMMAADFLYVGAYEALKHQASGLDIHYSWYAPIGSLIAKALEHRDYIVVNVAQHVGFWWHASWVLLFLNILPYSKHFHILTVIPNVFFADLRPNVLPKVEDMEEKVENEEPLGISTIKT